MKTSVLLVLVSVALAAGRQYGVYNEENLEELFEEFIKTHNKNYKDEAEKQRRFEIFKNNLEIIREMNAGREGSGFGITKFCDLTPEEFVKYHTGLNGNSLEPDLNCKMKPVKFASSAPESFDWRDKNVLSRVKDQQICGSCWAFGATGNLEAQYAIKYNETIELSEQQLVDCATVGAGGCRGAASLSVPFLYWMNNTGAELEQDYAYEDEQLECRYDASKVKVKVSSCASYRPASEEELKNLLYHVGPLTIGVSAKLTMQYYTGGILKESKCNPKELDHAVLLVGYGTDDIPYWVIKNSWGEGFGEKGYVRIQRGVNCVGIMETNPVTAIL